MKPRIFTSGEVDVLLSRPEYITLLRHALKDADKDVEIAADNLVEMLDRYRTKNPEQ